MHTTLLIPLLAALVVAIPSYPQVTPPGALANKRDLTQVTITLANSMQAPIMTSIASNEGTALASGGDSPTSTIAAGASASIVAPQNWAGNVAVGLANYSTWSMPSLVEAALTTVAGEFMFDIDVSYVNGYTVPITCTCNSDKTFLSGCSEDLWAQNTCGADGETDDVDKGVCVNPTNQASGAATSATTFFKPCQGKAYTYPNDNDANNEGKCQSGSATCCVGTSADGCPSAS